MIAGMAGHWPGHGLSLSAIHGQQYRMLSVISEIIRRLMVAFEAALYGFDCMWKMVDVCFFIELVVICKCMLVNWMSVDNVVERLRI